MTNNEMREFSKDDYEDAPCHSERIALALESIAGSLYVIAYPLHELKSLSAEQKDAARDILIDKFFNHVINPVANS